MTHSADLDGQWHSVHIYYYDDDKDDLILDCVRPLLEAVAPPVERSFFVRHWLRGPHLRLRFFATEEEFTGVVRPVIEERVGSYLRAHPSTATVDVERMLPVYQKLAVAEQEEGPLMPLYPDNSIQYLPYDRRLHVLGSDLLATLIEDFYVDSNHLALDMLAAVRAGRSRLELSLDLMFATAHVLGTHIKRGFLSYRSHADAFLIASSNPAALRDRFDRTYAARARVLTARLNELLASLDRGDGIFPFTLDWGQLLKGYWQRAEPLIESGSLDMMPGAGDDVPEYGPELKANIHHSTFHSIIDGSRAYRQALYGDRWFQCYRLMLNLLYLHLYRLGLRPTDRYLLCHLAANTVEDLFGISAAEMIGRFSPGRLAAAS